MAKIISVLGWILLIWFFWSRQVYAGGIPGEVIDYTLLEKLQKEYATSSEIYTDRPQISATRTEAKEEIATSIMEKKKEKDERKSFIKWLIDLIKSLFSKE